MTTRAYATAAALRAALEDRLRRQSVAEGVDLQWLRRRVAFERLLARLFAGGLSPWLLKGGFMLDLHLSDRARTTLDLDLSIPDVEAIAAGEHARAPLQRVHEAFQRAAGKDPGDSFVFNIGAPRAELTGAPGGGGRFPVEARLAGRLFARFHLDAGLGDVVVGQPVWVEFPSSLSFAGFPPVRVALYPVAQVFAEKIHACTFPWADRENTRVKDLIDLMLLL